MPTRRQFLALLAAAAVAPPRRLAASQRRGPAQRVIVLGGGLAGLCAAYELQALGHTATVLEAQTHPGGRVRTIRAPYAPGLYTEAGAETIPGVHDITQHYARTLGLTLVPTSIPGTRPFVFVKGQRIVTSDTSAVWPYDLTADERALGRAGLFRKYLDEATQQARAAGFPQQTVRALTPFDGFTPGAWLRSRGASAAAADMLTLGFGTDFGSAASFLLHGLNAGGAVSYRIEGGNDRLPMELARRVEIRYGSPVLSVRQSDTGVAVVVGTQAGSTTLEADRAVCALPCPVIGSIFDAARLSSDKARAIREQHYSRTVKVFLQTRTRFWLKDGWNGFVTTDLPIERLTPDPGADPGSRGALAAYPIAAYTSELEKMTEDERVKAALLQAQQIFPDLASACEGGVSHCWGLDPWERGSFALHTPGQIGFLDVLAKPEGRIHFSGEHTSPWTGWMQGALESGRRVVDEINRSGV
jgi:monoamine oxidase